MLNQETKRPVKADFLLEHFEIRNEFAIGEHKKFSLFEPKEKVIEITHKNNLSDLDFNNHVNNKSYINVAEATAPIEFKKNYALKSLNIKFCKESFLDDILVCSAYKTDFPNTFVHKITKDCDSICEIQTVWGEKSTDESIMDYALKIKTKE